LGIFCMFRLSYYGFSELLKTIDKPTHIKAIFPAMTLNDFQNNMINHYGAQKITSLKTWVLESIVPDLLKRKFQNDNEYQEKMIGRASCREREKISRGEDKRKDRE